MNYAKRIFKMLGLICLVGIITTIVLCLMWKQNEILKEEGIRLPYLDEVTHFEIHYPYKWEAARSILKQNEKKGICVYVNKDEEETIYCYYTEKDIELERNDLESQSIVTDLGLRGIQINNDQNQRESIDIIFEGKRYGIHIDVSEKTWEEYKEPIMKIVKSFKITQQ